MSERQPSSPTMKSGPTEHRTVYPDEALTHFRADVLSGLSANPKSIPSKYFYDEAGSALFDRICQLDEYYLTRAELEIMRTYADEMSQRCGPRCMLVEYGSGSSVKTEILLDHLDRAVAYVPIDISELHLYAAADRLRQRFPDLPILPVAADYTNNFEMPELPASPRRTVVYFPGSTIGNFERANARAFLFRVRALCEPEGALLIGVDLKKDPAIIEAAYDDAAGVTAAFNLNLLTRMNRELDATFDLQLFEHRAFYDTDAGRVEMQLVSRRDQQVHIGNHVVRFLRDEAIRTEYSHKYSIEEFRALALEADLRPVRAWTDSMSRFSVHYLEPV